MGALAVLAAAAIFMGIGYLSVKRVCFLIKRIDGK